MFLIKLLAAAGTHQEEEIIRSAERMEKERNVACADLRANMAKNAVYCKQALANTKKLGETIATNLVKVAQSISISQDAEARFTELRRNQAAEEELEAHKPDWDAAIHEWLEKAHGVDPTTDSDNPDTMALAKLLAEYLAKGEPKAAEHSTCIITYHPNASIDVALKVAYASGSNAPFNTGETLRKTSKTVKPVSEAIWTVVETGISVLDNPYNHPEVAKEAVSVVPLSSAGRKNDFRHRFGAIVSGPPALPDEYLHTFAETAGQMFERIGKLEIVWRFCRNVQTFIEKQCLGAHKLVVVKFEKDKGATEVENEWDWQPLEYTHPKKERTFEVPLQWSGGEKIGLFSVECATFTEMDEQLIVLLHTCAQLLLDAVEEAEKLELGSDPPLHTVGEVMEAYEKGREKIADVLAQELARRVKTSLTFYNSITEMHSYCGKVDDENIKRVAQAVLTLAGLPCGDWKTVRKQLTQARSITESLADAQHINRAIQEKVDLEIKSIKESEGQRTQKKEKKKKKTIGKLNKTRWNIAEAYLNKVDLVELAQRSPVPIRNIIRWITASRYVYNIGVAMTLEKEEAQNEEAQKVFVRIDTDGDGILSTDEIITFLVSEYGAKPAMRFLRVIDANADGSVTNQEWHKAWRNGEFDVEIDDDVEDGHRVLSRHFSSGSIHVASPPGSSRRMKLDPLQGGRGGSHAPAEEPAGKKKRDSKEKGGKSRESKVAPVPTW